MVKKCKKQKPLSVACMALALFWIKKESIKHSVAFMFRDATPYYLQAIISFSLAIFLYFEMGNVILLKDTISNVWTVEFVHNKRPPTTVD